MATPQRTPQHIPGPQERREIGARAFMSERQVLLVYREPDGRRPSVVARVQRAACELGLPVPQTEPRR